MTPSKNYLYKKRKKDDYGNNVKNRGEQSMLFSSKERNNPKSQLMYTKIQAFFKIKKLYFLSKTKKKVTNSKNKK